MARSAPPPNTKPQPSPLAQQLPLVSGRWLLGCLIAIFGGGLALLYLTLCLLFWQGQWQILFHPAHTVSATPAAHGIAFEQISFGADEAGQPSLDGWYIPSAPEGAYAGKTLLYLHAMDSGSLSDCLPQLAELHALGIGILAFDYRGFGKSAFVKPSERSTTEDTEAAWHYLVETRHVAPGSIYLYGVGLGASLAPAAAARHPEAAGVILDTPAPAALDLLRADPRSHGLPLWLLAHDRFDPAKALAEAKQPKLFLLPEGDAAGERYAHAAADPKLVVYLGSSSSASALRRFLDER